MRFEVLGPLKVVAGEPVAISATRLRVLLAVLLWRANESVSADELFESVWNGKPPKDAPGALRALILRLRRVLGAQGSERIVWRAPGYMIAVGDGELDAVRFEALCRETGVAVNAGRWAQAAGHAAAALALWRGRPLDDVPCHALHERWVPHLEQTRLQVLEWRCESDLHLGRYEDVVARLRQLVELHPLRERFQIQLMTALAGVGRQSDALAVYRRARRTLVDELGVEPGPELSRVHERILAGDPGLFRAPQETGEREHRSDEPQAPRQLPGAARHFTGRRDELDLLTGLAEGAGPGSAPVGPVVVCAVDGMGGIGKTALAVHAAHRLADRFPDGQLFLNLYGHTKDRAPREPSEALGSLLRTLGVPAVRIPADPDERAALYRQHLSGTRTLILLDNARDEAQVRPLLPGTPGCLVLVTSRRRLKGLHDAHIVALDVLTHADALALLRAQIPSAPTADEDPYLVELAELCGRLPLALRIVGALLRHRPAWTPQYLAELLRDERRRLAALTDGDHDVRAVLDLSYTRLEERCRLLFRRLALVPGPDLDAFAAAVLLDADPASAAGLLEDLVDHHLLIEHAPGRYRLHDLVRAHARALAGDDPRAGRDRAVDRLMRYYAHTAQNASRHIARHPLPAPPGPAPADTPALADAESARAWLRAERENLEAAHAHAPDRHVPALAAGLAEILRLDGPYNRALELHEATADLAERRHWSAELAAALRELARVRRFVDDLARAEQDGTRALEIFRAIGDRRGEADVLLELGNLRRPAGDLPGALDAASQALEIYQAIGERHGEASALSDIGRARFLTGAYPRAAEAATRGLEIYRAIGNRAGEADALNDLVRVQLMTGSYTEAAKAATESLEIYRAIGNRAGEGNVLLELGSVLRLAGDLPGASDAASQALELFRALASRHGEASALTDLCRTHLAAGAFAEAAEAGAGGLEIFREIGSRNGESWALNFYAAAVLAGGQPDAAASLFRQALDMNRELDKPDDQAIALEGLGECRLVDGDAAAAAADLNQAFEIFRRLGMDPDANRVRDRLARLARLASEQ